MKNVSNNDSLVLDLKNGTQLKPTNKINMGFGVQDVLNNTGYKFGGRRNASP